LEIYKKDHGHLNIPSSHEELGYWTSNVRRSYKYLQEGKKTGMTEERANQLRAMGFSFLVGKRKTGRVEMKAWDDQFELLREFKTEHGHSKSVHTTYMHAFVVSSRCTNRSFCSRNNLPRFVYSCRPAALSWSWPMGQTAAPRVQTNEGRKTHHHVTRKSSQASRYRICL